MARAATTTDAFNAVAEPRRREILDLLSGGELSVGDIVSNIPVSQPQVSKHLKVLRSVGLVQSRSDGRQRLYSLDPVALKPMHDWVSQFEEMWIDRLDRLDSYLSDLQKEQK
ncbi:MAG: metalloregulator ArsR/SmtB family transcription factor [Acidimicrobiia bacterium]